MVRHCLTAAAVGEALAAELSPRLPGLDVDLVRAGCLLHDIARLSPHHADLAAEALARLGLPPPGSGGGRAHGHRLPSAARPGLTEAELVYLADKTVADGEVVGLDERQARAIRKMRPDSQTAAQIAGRIGEGRLIADKVAAVLGRSVEDVLGEVDIPGGGPRWTSCACISSGTRSRRGRTASASWARATRLSAPRERSRPAGWPAS